ATAQPMGPVHINVPLREPLYRSNYPAVPSDDRLRTIAPALAVEAALSAPTWQQLADQWHSAQRKLIVVGQHVPDGALHIALRALQADPSVTVIGDMTSNLFVAPQQLNSLARWDCALASRDRDALERLGPDLVLWCGGQ